MSGRARSKIFMRQYRQATSSTHLLESCVEIFLIPRFQYPSGRSNQSAWPILRSIAFYSTFGVHLCLLKQGWFLHSFQPIQECPNFHACRFEHKFRYFRQGFCTHFADGSQPYALGIKRVRSNVACNQLYELEVSLFFSYRINPLT